MGPRPLAQEFVPLEEDVEEVTDLGPSALARRLCLFCRGSGELLTLFFFPSILSRRSCVLCRGTGFHQTLVRVGRRRS